MRTATIGLRLVLVLGLGCALTAAARAGNWPRFRGPNGTGIAADKDIPVHWTESSGVLWKTELPGAGHSSPVVWGDRLFIESATAKERLLLCVRVTDGKLLWSKAMAGGTARKHPKSSFASSTPATDGDRVYAVFWDGRDVWMLAYDFAGKQLWKRDLGPFTSQHGPGASPVVYAGKVYLNNDQDGAAELIALDAKTGAVAWRAKRRAFRTCYSTPFLLEQTKGKPELVVVSTAGITGYNPATGKENWDWVWHFSNMALRTVGSAVAGHGIIFAGSGDGSGERHAVAVRAGARGDSGGGLVWERKRDFPYVPSMLVRGDHLYWVNDKGKAGCCDARTGKVVWEQRLLDRGAVSASPLLIDGKIYAISENGEVFVFPAAPEFKLLAKNSVGERVFATPAVADNRLFIRGEKHLFCIGKAAVK